MIIATGKILKIRNIKSKRGNDLCLYTLLDENNNIHQNIMSTSEAKAKEGQIVEFQLAETASGFVEAVKVLK